MNCGRVKGKGWTKACLISKRSDPASVYVTIEPQLTRAAPRRLPGKQTRQNARHYQLSLRYPPPSFDASSAPFYAIRRPNVKRPFIFERRLATVQDDARLH